MAKKKVELFIDIENQKDFEQILRNNLNTLICAEIYNNFAGPCTALDRLFTKIKHDWSDGKMILLKVPAENIDSLTRFCGQSEPVYMFIINSKVIRVFRGVDSIQFGEIAKAELRRFKVAQDGSFCRPTYDLDEPTPDEMEKANRLPIPKPYSRVERYFLIKRLTLQRDRDSEWLNKRALEKEQEITSAAARRAARQAARKRHRAELMVPHLKFLNFVLYWPHRKNAHPELYERWDVNNIIMVGREEVMLTKEKAEDILYDGDAPLNEASLHELLSGLALAICFRLLDTDKHFVSLIRKILYEELSQYDQRQLLENQRSPITAFDFYKSYSPTREEVLQRRREERARLKEEAKEKRARRLSEMQRLAVQAKLDAIEAKRVQKEQRKLELLKAGDLVGLQKLKEEASDVEENIDILEELCDETEEESKEEHENEYFPPPGLLIPGFYAPPTDIAKANGLAILFPKLVLDYVTPQSEFLPPHVLVMLEINKRYKAVAVLIKFKSSVIHMGIFKADSPYNGLHIAHSVKQYDAIADRISMNSHEMKIVFMLSVTTDVPLLELMDLNPVHVSRDTIIGEEECAAMFPVNYGDNYPEFEDF